MENNLNETLNKVVSEPGVVGCVFANPHGMCIGHKGKATPDSAGILAAIIDKASKLSPTSPSPVVSLDYGDKQCLVYRHNNVTGAVYRQKK